MEYSHSRVRKVIVLKVSLNDDLRPLTSAEIELHPDNLGGEELQKEIDDLTSGELRALAADVTDDIGFPEHKITASENLYEAVLYYGLENLPTEFLRVFYSLRYC